MKITLTKVKYAAFASEETSCFDACVCLDGIPSIHARNDGHGGSTDLHSIVDGALGRLSAYAGTLPPRTTDMDDPKEPGKKFSYAQDAESLVDDAFNVWLNLKQLRGVLKRTTAFIHKGEVQSFIKMPYAANREKLPAIMAKYPGAVVLNALPEEEALAIWMGRGEKIPAGGAA